MKQTKYNLIRKAKDGEVKIHIWKQKEIFN